MSIPSRYADQFVVRMPNGLRDRIALSAKQNLRSMNAEIVLHLLRAMGDDATGAGLATSTPAASPNNAVFEHGAHQPG
jgi:hypothetical protein